MGVLGNGQEGVKRGSYTHTPFSNEYPPKVCATPVVKIKGPGIEYGSIIMYYDPRLKNLQSLCKIFDYSR